MKFATMEELFERAHGPKHRTKDECFTCAYCVKAGDLTPATEAQHLWAESLSERLRRLSYIPPVLAGPNA